MFMELNEVEAQTVEIALVSMLEDLKSDSDHPEDAKALWPFMKNIQDVLDRYFPDGMDDRRYRIDSMGRIHRAQ
jgi:hypothetical protein